MEVILSSSMTAVINDIQGIHCVNNCKVLLSTDTQLASFGNPFMCMQFKEVCMQYRTVRCRNRAGGKLRICHCCCHTVSGGALLLAAKQLTNCTACGKTLVVNFQSFGRVTFIALSLLSASLPFYSVGCMSMSPETRRTAMLRCGKILACFLFVSPANTTKLSTP